VLRLLALASVGSDVALA